ncbi:hypothetical protein R3P38DRAFT_1632390 [Favolaschia claudopus]|uniref:Uncharacterized protein n=1 Tax=Favolaschia claudopus TaxID=2862362 RepID=A0AAW0DLL1_9AGAR
MGAPHSFMVLLPVFAWLLLLSCSSFVDAAVTNTTVDDTSSAFSFTGSWTAVSPSQPCDFCSSKPDSAQTFGSSWHDGNYRDGAPSATGGSFTFKGSAVYIYGIDQAKSQPDIAFTLGSTKSVHHYTGSERFAYNALFFSAKGLAADQTHTVTWNFNINPSTGVGVQAALFDYAIVTSGTEDSGNSGNTGNTGNTGNSDNKDDNSDTNNKNQNSVPPVSSSSPPSTSSNGQSSVSKTASVTASGVGQKLAPSATNPLENLSSPSAQVSPGSSPGAASNSNSTPAGAASSHHSNIGPILGAVFGVLAAVILALVFFLLCHRRRQTARAREDEERRAAGLPPVQPGMRRARDGPVLQPFVDDRPDGLAGSSNVFAGPLATASSANACAPPGPVNGSSRALAPSSPPGGDSPMSGISTLLGTSATGAPQLPPPPFMEPTSGGLGAYPSEKSQDMGYTDPHNQSGPSSNNVSRQPSQTSLTRLDTRLPPVEKQQAEPETTTTPSSAPIASVTSPTTMLSPSTMISPSSDTTHTTSARERYLEQRLATLEAHVAAYLPPPYEQAEQR